MIGARVTVETDARTLATAIGQAGGTRTTADPAIADDTVVLFARALLRSTGGVCVDGATPASITHRPGPARDRWTPAEAPVSPMLMAVTVEVDVVGLHGMHACAARDCPGMTTQEAHNGR